MKRFLATIREADIRNTVAVITSVGSYVILVYLISKAIPQANHDIVIAAVGYVLGQSNGNVYGYLFNASKPEKPSKKAEQKPDEKSD
jgi:hypothetical protein